MSDVSQGFEFDDFILSMPSINGKPPVSERSLRTMPLIKRHREQMSVSRQLVA